MKTLCIGLHWAGNTVAYMSRMRRQGKAALLLILLFILAACMPTYPSPLVHGTPQPLSCGIFTDTRLQEFRFNVDSTADIAAALVKSWETEQDQIRFTNLYRDELGLQWSDNLSGRQIDYFALFGIERKLKLVDVNWSPAATLAQVIDCLGDPDEYNAHYGPSHHEAHFELALWYADEGIFVTHNHLTINLQRTPLRPAQQINGFSLVDPKRPEQALTSLLPSMGYADGDNPGIQAYVLCLLHEWPGSIETVEATGAESYDDNTRCKTVTYW